MCLAVPARIIEIIGEDAVLDYGGVQRKANISMLDDVKIGDYVLIHVGYAISKLEEEDARVTLELWDEMLEKTQ